MNDNVKDTLNSNLYHSKRKRMILIFIMIICAVNLIFASLLLDIPKEDVIPNNKEEEKKELTVEEKGILINNLMLIGVDIFDSGKYLELPKSDVSGYYATVSELKNMGYTNIDSLVTNCSSGHAVLFFDVDHLEKYPDGYPIMVVYDCGDF